MNVNVPFFAFFGIGLIFFSFGEDTLVPIVLRKSAFLVERTYTMNGLFALGQSVPWLTNDHFEKNLFENSRHI